MRFSKQFSNCPKVKKSANKKQMFQASKSFKLNKAQEHWAQTLYYLSMEKNS